MNKIKKLSTAYAETTVTPYGFSLTIAITKDYEAAAGAIEGLGCDISGRHAVAISAEMEAMILFDENQITHGVIAHEAFHVVRHIFKTIGDSVQKCNEPAAYLLDWIVQWIHQIATKAGVEIK